MKKFIIVIAVAMSLTLSGCKDHTVQEPSEITQENEIETIAESIANTEYDSIEDFLQNSNATVFMMDSKQPYNNVATNSNAANSNATTFNAIDKNVSDSQSYISIIYECEVNDNTFKVDLSTFKTSEGAEQLAYVVDSNPGIFTEVNISGISAYYCPGSEYDWFDCYAMIINKKLVVIDIEKGYDTYIEDVLNNIVLQ